MREGLHPRLKSKPALRTGVSIAHDLKRAPYDAIARCPPGVIVEEATFEETAELQSISLGRDVTNCAIAPLYNRPECTVIKSEEKNACSIRFSEASDSSSVEGHVELKIESCLKRQPLHNPQIYVTDPREFLECSMKNK